jgi:hypothetical protein
MPIQERAGHRSDGISQKELVAPTFAGWNQNGGWLRRLDALQQAA